MGHTTSLSGLAYFRLQIPRISNPRSQYIIETGVLIFGKVRYETKCIVANVFAGKMGLTFDFFAMSDNSDFTTISSWDGGEHTTENSSNNTIWYNNVNNLDDLPKSYTFGAEKDTSTDQYKGTLYNWYVATAGKGLNATPENAIVEDSICPKKWQLPNVDGDKSYTVLADGTTTTKVQPYSSIAVGIYTPNMGAVGERNSTYFWLNTKGNRAGNSQPFAFYIGPGSEYVWVTGAGHGFSIRCVLK